MTTSSPKPTSTLSELTLAQKMVNNMWTFWILLLVISLGLATVVYYVWLRGNI